MSGIISWELGGRFMKNFRLDTITWEQQELQRSNCAYHFIGNFAVITSQQVAPLPTL